MDVKIKWIVDSGISGFSVRYHLMSNYYKAAKF